MRRCRYMSLRAAEYVQEQFSQKIGEIDRDRKVAARGKNWRRSLAYILKAVSVFGGIAWTCHVFVPPQVLV